MPTSPGWPSKLYPPQPPSVFAQGPQLPTAIVLQYPPVGQESIPAGATVTPQAMTAPMRVLRIVVSLPPSVTAYLELDGTRLINSQDNLGLVGQLEVGDASANLGYRINRLAGSFTNNNSSARDARFWVVGVPT